MISLRVVLFIETNFTFILEVWYNYSINKLIRNFIMDIVILIIAGLIGVVLVGAPVLSANALMVLIVALLVIILGIVELNNK
jgi:hypothetical protein